MAMVQIDDVVLFQHLKAIYSTMHGCALRESEMHVEDYARGLTPGQLCDDCMAYIKAHIHDIKDGTY